MLINADRGDAVEPGGVVDQDSPTFGQDRAVGGVPRHPQALGDPGHAQVLAHDALQRPAQAAARQLGPRLGRARGVLAPHMTTPRAPVATDRDQQCRGAPPERLVRQPARKRVPRRPFAPTPTTPLIGFHDPARQDRTIRLQALPHDLETKLIQTAEGTQVRTGEGSVRHVEVFPMDSVRTPIIGRPRPLPGQRHARPTTPSFAKSRFT